MTRIALMVSLLASGDANDARYFLALDKVARDLRNSGGPETLWASIRSTHKTFSRVRSKGRPLNVAEVHTKRHHAAAYGKALAALWLYSAGKAFDLQVAS